MKLRVCLASATTQKPGSLVKLKPEYYTPCMEKLDGLSWIDGGVYTALGCDIGFRANSLEAVRELSQHIPAWFTISPSIKVDRVISYIKGGKRGNRRNFNLLYVDHSLAARSHEFDQVLERFVDVMEITAGEKAKDRVVLHAGSVSWRGKGIVVPGRSHSGKSTLVVELLKLGASFYSDEYTVIDRNGNIEPLARPLHVRDSLSGFQSRVEPTEVGAEYAQKPVPVSLVALLEYQERGKFNEQSLSAGQSVMRLMENSFSARNQPALVLECLENLVRKARVFESKRGEAVYTARGLVGMLDKLAGH